MPKEFDQQVAWGIFEQYAEDTSYESFNVVADYSYGSLKSFYQSAIEFVKAKVKFRKELEKEFGTKI